MKYVYKSLPILLTLLFIHCTNTKSFAQFQEAGTENDPFLIETVEDLLYLNNTSSLWSNGYFFKLMSDIDMAGETFYPIGIKQASNNISDTFTGSFNGNYHIIKNLTVTKHPDQVNVGIGFIGYGRDCSITNLGLIDVNIQGKSNSIERAGGIIGVMELSTNVENCFVLGGIVSGSGNVGGIAGMMLGNTIQNCFTDVEITANWGKNGGIVGNASLLYGSANISNSLSYGNTHYALTADNTFPDNNAVITGLYTLAIDGISNDNSSVSELSVLEMTDQDNVSALDFSDTGVWAMNNKSYPVLKGFIDINEEVYSSLPSYFIIPLAITSNGVDPIQGASILINDVIYTTDENGIISKIIFDGTYNYTVNATNYLEFTGTFTTQDNDLRNAITLSLITYKSTFNIVDDNGNKLTNADILISNGSNINQSALSDENGQAVFNSLPKGNYTYSISKNLFDTQNGSFEIIDQDIEIAETVIGNIISLEAKELITNGDFEDTLDKGWNGLASFSRESNVLENESNSLKIETNSKIDFIRTSDDAFFDLEVGKSYRISGKIKADQMDFNALYFRLMPHDAIWRDVEKVVVTLPSLNWGWTSIIENEWVYFENDITIQEGFQEGTVNGDIISSKLFIQSSNNNSDAVIYLDDLSVKENNITLEANAGDDLYIPLGQSSTLTAAVNTRNDVEYTWIVPNGINLTSTNKVTTSVTCSENLSNAKTYTVLLKTSIGNIVAYDAVNITFGDVYTFTGAEDNFWNNKNNWNLNGEGIPTEYPGENNNHLNHALVYIPTLKTVNITEDDNVDVYSTLIESNTTVIIDTDKLSFKGDATIRKEATFNTSNLTIELNGDSEQLINIEKEIYNLFINGNGQKILQSDLSILGNFENKSVYPISTNSNSITFSGTSQQKITSDHDESFYHLIINNPNGVDSDGTISIEDELTLNAGNLFVSNLILEENVSEVISSHSSYVIGKVTKKNLSPSDGFYTFPVGSSTTYARAGVKISDEAEVSDFHVEYLENDHIDDINNNHDGFYISENSSWDIHGYGIYTEGVQIRLYFEEPTAHFSSSSLEEGGTNLTIGHFQSDTNEWEKVECSWNQEAATTAHYLESNIGNLIQSFSTFAGGSTIEEDLPVELTYFNASVLKNNTVLLEWETASELNASHFIIERSSDGIHYSEIGRIEAYGNSNTLLQYQFSDTFSSLAFYRLIQYDFDDAFEIFGPLRVMNETYQPKKATLIVLPNPISGNTISVFLEGLSHKEKYEFQVISIDGKVIYTMNEQTNASGFAHHKIDVSNWKYGMYTLKIRTASQQIIYTKIIR